MFEIDKILEKLVKEIFKENFKNQILEWNIYHKTFEFLDFFGTKSGMNHSVLIFRTTLTILWNGPKILFSGNQVWNQLLRTSVLPLVVLCLFET